MFNLLVSADSTAWESDQRMAMMASRFGEYSGDEYTGISTKNQASLKRLEQVPTLLMYEDGVDGPNTDFVRVGQMRDIRLSGGDITFRFAETGRIPREKVDELAHRLQLDPWERARTHWAVKDGSIPQELLIAMTETPKRYDIVLSFAGEDRGYVEDVAEFLNDRGVVVFYDKYEQVTLWGKKFTRTLRKHLPPAGTVLRDVHFKALRGECLGATRASSSARPGDGGACRVCITSPLRRYRNSRVEPGRGLSGPERFTAQEVWRDDPSKARPSLNQLSKGKPENSRGDRI